MEAKINLANVKAEELIKITGQKYFTEAIYKAIYFTLLHEADNVQEALK